MSSDIRKQGLFFLFTTFFLLSCSKPTIDVTQIEGYWFLVAKETASTELIVPKESAPLLQFQESSIIRLSGFPQPLSNQGFFLLDQEWTKYSVEQTAQTRLIFDEGNTADVMKLTATDMELQIEREFVEATYRFIKASKSEALSIHNSK